MTLNKRYNRNIRENLSFYVSATVLTVVTLLMFYLFNIAGKGINEFGDEFFERNNLEDAEFSTYTPISDDDISKLEEKYDLVLERQNYMNITEDDFTARVFKATEKINLYEITEGEDVSADDEIIISEGYAVNMNVKIGDKITIRDKDYKVTGFFQRPDYLYMLEDPDDAYKNITTFFLAYMTDEEFDSLGEPSAQYFVKYNKDNITDVRREINDDYITQSYLSAEENTRILMVHEQADMYIEMAYIILVIMPLIAVTLICIILSRKVKSEQKLIGTLTALGYKKGRLMAHYAGFAAIPGLFGGVLTYLLTSIFSQPYGEMCLADYEPMRATFKLSPFTGILGIVIPTVMYIIAAIASVGKMLKNDAVTMLNGAVGENKKKKRLFANSKMPLRRKYALRSLLGNPARSFVVVLGVFLGSFIMFFMLAIVDSIDEVSQNGTKQVGSYEYEYVLNVLKTEEPEEGEPVLAANFEDENQSSLPIYGINEDNPYLNLRDENGREITLGDGYYITSVSAYLMNLGAGDTATLYNPLSLEDVEVKIDGVIDNDMQKGVFTSRKNAEELLGVSSGSYNAVMSDEKLSLDDSEVAATVKLSAVADQADEMVSQMGMIIYLGVVLGAIICVAAIYVAVNMLMTENRNNISMLKVLGYNDSRINSMVLNVNHILLPIGILIGIPSCYAIMDVYLRWFASYIGMIISASIKPLTYVIVIALTCVCYFGSVYFIRRKTKKVDMVESLKDNRE